ncbi:MAG: c-type cytochrome domain-containing protein, partial [Planctomycetota bacterium]|nr:c-type cytochrome domain-containing protein [Planctomycetota bacterium]
MRDKTLPSRVTTTTMALAIFLGSAFATIAQDKPSPADALKAAIAKTKQLEAKLSQLKAEAAKAEKAAAKVAADLKAQQAAAAKIAALQQAELKKKADAAAARQKVADAATKAARTKAQAMKDEVAKLKAGVAKATNDQKAAEKNVKPQTDAAKKATDAKTAADKEAAVAAKALADAQKRAKAAMDKATKATTAAKAASDTLKKTNDTIATSKKTVIDSNAKVKTTEAAIAKFAPELAKAEASLESQTLASISAAKQFESVLIATGQMVSFSESVAPIFAQRCVACHNARTAKGRLNLDSFAATLKGGESGVSFESGKADESTLIAMIEDGSMPKDADPLTADQISLIKKWINTGAKLNAGVGLNDPLIAIVPKRPQPMPPKAYRVPVPVTAVAFSPDGKQLASSGYHEVIIWNAADGKMVRRITNIAERVYDITFSADGKQMAVAAGTPGQIGE